MKTDTFIYLSLITILTISLIVVLNHMSASPRGSEKNPIALYIPNEPKEVWYKTDTGSLERFDLGAVDSLVHRQVKVIDSLIRLEEAMNVGFASLTLQVDTIPASASNPFKPLPRPPSIVPSRPIKPPHYKEEEQIMEYYATLAQDMQDRLECGCPHLGDSIDAAIALYEKRKAFKAYAYDEGINQLDIAQYKKERCKELK